MFFEWYEKSLKRRLPWISIRDEEIASRGRYTRAHRHCRELSATARAVIVARLSVSTRLLVSNCTPTSTSRETDRAGPTLFGFIVRRQHVVWRLCLRALWPRWKRGKVERGSGSSGRSDVIFYRLPLMHRIISLPSPPFVLIFITGETFFRRYSFQNIKCISWICRWDISRLISKMHDTIFFSFHLWSALLIYHLRISKGKFEVNVSIFIHITSIIIATNKILQIS